VYIIRNSIVSIYFNFIKFSVTNQRDVADNVNEEDCLNFISQFSLVDLIDSFKQVSARGEGAVGGAATFAVVRRGSRDPLHLGNASAASKSAALSAYPCS
jgi:hypothetical protein